MEPDPFYCNPRKLIMRSYQSPLELSGPGAPDDIPLEADIILKSEGDNSTADTSPGQYTLGLRYFELTCLRDFCDSFTGYAIITISIIPTDRVSIARRVLGIGRTRMTDSAIVTSMDDRMYQLSYGEVEETRSEMVLRTMGSFSYAACVLLNDNRYGYATSKPIAGIGYDRYNTERAEEWAMESLVAMIVGKRHRNYAVGENVLARFEKILEWAALVDSTDTSIDGDMDSEPR
jgi:hypothetical protein